MNIENYDKAEVLAALYNNAKVLGMGILQAESGDMSKDEAAKILEDTPEKYFDYLKGRVMKISLEKDEVSTFLYNRDNGEGAAESVVDALGK
jgi:hypothetical protein|tara:strand:- start:2360 stop:2635 length:276 start_codon:yes stop_codon:yes gene_type:complete